MTKSAQIPVFKLGIEAGLGFRAYELRGEDNSSSDLPHIVQLPHRHDFHEVIVFMEAGGSHLIDFVEYPIRKQSIHFVSPGQPHLVTRTRACRGYLFTFSRDYLASALDPSFSIDELPFVVWVDRE